MLHEFLGRLGIYYAKRRFMPSGIDWLWDINRCSSTRRVRTVFDVGANEGQTASAVLSAFPSALVHAFEPVSANFEILRKALGAEPRLSLNRVAVSSTPGVVRVRANAQLSHIVVAAVVGAADIEAVAAVTLDAYCQQHQIAHIDILKTDTEGHDLDVLKGATELFRAGKVDWVFVEVTFDPSDATHSHFGATCEWLDAHGLAPWCFYDHCHVDEGRTLLFCNVLFAKRPSAAADTSGP